LRKWGTRRVLGARRVLVAPSKPTLYPFELG
jgi:hypothetical protein